MRHSAGTIDRAFTNDAVVSHVNDRELLELFAKSQDELAFETLVERYGALVQGVCRRSLKSEQDIEDAFQSTFLILAKKAGSIRRTESLSSWLYGVAFRVAFKLKQSSATRRIRESRRIEMQESNMHNVAGDECGAKREIQQLLDEELSNLATKYRKPIILCYLQGKTNEEAARELGFASGSFAKRISQAREMLRSRLTKRGAFLASGQLVLLLENCGSAVSDANVASTARGAANFVGKPVASPGSASERAISIAKGELRMMLCKKASILSVIILLVAGSGAVSVRAATNVAPTIWDSAVGVKLNGFVEHADGKVNDFSGSIQIVCGSNKSRDFVTIQDSAHNKLDTQIVSNVSCVYNTVTKVLNVTATSTWVETGKPCTIVMSFTSSSDTGVLQPNAAVNVVVVSEGKTVLKASLAPSSQNFLYAVALTN